MMVDTNIIIDLIEAGEWFQWSAAALADAQYLGGVSASAIVVGEMASRTDTVAEAVDALARFDIAVLPLDAVTAHHAGTMHKRYRAAGGQRERLLGDFLIGGHGLSVGAALITRDPRYYRRYFPALPLITPETHP